MCYPDKSVFFPFVEGEHGNPLFISLAGREFCSSNYRIYRKTAAESVLCYVWQGEGIVKCKDSEQLAREGDVLLLLKGEEHSYRVNPENPWRVLWFNITGGFFPELASAYHLAPGIYPMVSARVSSLFEKGLQSCFHALQAQKLSSIQLELNRLIFAIIQALSEEFPAKSDGGAARNIQLYIDRQLQNHPECKLSSRQMEQELSLSARQCSRIFYSYYGMTPYEYYMEQKAKLAKNLVLNTALSIREISERFGFCDSYYFSAFFKRYFQISPGKLRKNNAPKT